MKVSCRLLTAALFCVLVVIVLYTTFTTNNPFHDVWTQYSVPTFIVHTFHPPTSFFHSSSSHPSSLTSSSSSTGGSSKIITSKTIVIAKTKSEDTTWVSHDLFDWNNAIYAVDRPKIGEEEEEGGGKDEEKAQPKKQGLHGKEKQQQQEEDLSTPANKGHEAMAYLTYIIDHYSHLPDIIAFLHPHRAGFFSAWHTDTPLHSNPDALRALNLSYVQQQGYVNLRCNWSPGCRAQDRINAHVTEEIWNDVFEGTSLAQEPFPGEVGQACCAQFAVTGQRVRERPRKDYESVRQWLVATELGDRKSGRVMEFLWQVIFGHTEGVFCPAQKECYCNVYGRC